MKILVLGGTGAMGVDLVKILAQRGENIIVTSRSKRKSNFNNVKYVEGNAHNDSFLKSLLNQKYDAVVDFMVYNTEEFRSRCNMFLNATNQYIFLSSSRVYADSETPITENTYRLLDVSKDKEYIKTDEYALTKARQENLLRESGKTNWTIVRPYITYSNQRLQLGVYEKELWLYRALYDKTIVLPKAIVEKYTTMTLGSDVARGISKLIGNENAIGQAFHIATDRSIKWHDVLVIYKSVFKELTGRDIKIKYVDDLKPIYEVMGNKYQTIYDRFFDRKFDNSKFLQVAGECTFEEPEIGLRKCMKEFLDNPEFNYIYPSSLAFMDRMTKDRANLSTIPGIKEKGKYVMKRYLPCSILHRLKTVLK